MSQTTNEGRAKEQRASSRKRLLGTMSWGTFVLSVVAFFAIWSKVGASTTTMAATTPAAGSPTQGAADQGSPNGEGFLGGDDGSSMNGDGQSSPGTRHHHHGYASYSQQTPQFSSSAS